MSFPKVRIGSRLGFGFAAVLAVSVVIAGVGSWKLNALAEDAGRLMAEPLMKERLGNEWLLTVSLGMQRQAAIAKSNDDAVSKFFESEAKASTARTGELIKSANDLASTDEERKLLATIDDQRKLYLVQRSAMNDAKKAGNHDEGERVYDTGMAPIAQTYMASIRSYSALQSHKIETIGARLKADASKAHTGLVLLGLLGLALGGGLAWSLSRSITRPLAEALAHAQAVAGGDLTRQVDVRGSDEVASLQRALQDMQAHLVTLVSKVRQGVDSVGTASEEIARGNTDLSQRTEQAASNLQKTASSMEQLTGTVRQTADSARTANQLASSASAVAQRGGAVVAQVVSTMDAINTSSRKIADIIGTIDGIAFQTNILALNAAVEAARAGDQGRGFAVVASEVRSLAQRSAEAAREIKSLIGASVEKVDSGSQLVADAGATMTEIVSSVQRVTDIIGEISAAAAEQSSGIAQVNSAVVGLDAATQQNAALVEQSAAAAESLKDQSRQLAGVVAAFRVTSAGASANTSTGGPAAAAQASAAATVAARAPGAQAKVAAVAGSAIAKARGAAAKVVGKPAAAAATASATTAGSAGKAVAPAAANKPAQRAEAPVSQAPAALPKPAAAAGNDSDWETF